jgi:Leucine-rich repeat (LRR) protein
MTGVTSLSTLTSANNISLYNNPNMPCNDIDALDVALGDDDGGSAGSVVWNTCFVDVAMSSVFANISDTALAACVREHVANMTVVSELTTLNCSNRGITNITGIEQLQMLRSLDLSGNGISNFTPIQGLRNLTALNLNSTDINTISSLLNLKNLQQLHLDSTQLTSIGFDGVSSATNLSDSLTSLNILSLRFNKLSNGVFTVRTLSNARLIDLTCSPDGLEPSITALDNVLDQIAGTNPPTGDGPDTGIVRWSTISSGNCGRQL